MRAEPSQGQKRATPSLITEAFTGALIYAAVSGYIGIASCKLRGCEESPATGLTWAQGGEASSFRPTGRR